MMALRTAATGMAAQQLNVEVISNNIANMNTVGFKKGRAEFEDLLYQNTSNLQSKPATDVKLRQGMLEGSNVQPILEISRMIEVSRAYDQMAQLMNSQADLSAQAIQTLGKSQ